MQTLDAPVQLIPCKEHVFDCSAWAMDHLLCMAVQHRARSCTFGSNPRRGAVTPRGSGGPTHTHVHPHRSWGPRHAWSCLSIQVLALHVDVALSFWVPACIGVALGQGQRKLFNHKALDHVCTLYGVAPIDPALLVRSVAVNIRIRPLSPWVGTKCNGFS